MGEPPTSASRSPKTVARDGDNGTLPGITVYAGRHVQRGERSRSCLTTRATTWLLVFPCHRQYHVTVVVSRSADATHVERAPFTVSNTPDADKTWIACDNTSEQPALRALLYRVGRPQQTTASCGDEHFQRWRPDLERRPANTADSAKGIGGVPCGSAHGNVVVPASGMTVARTSLPLRLKRRRREGPDENFEPW